MTGVVAGGNPDTVAAGLRALELGGNAVDAAVAATLMACVSEPLLTGLGGGGLATVRMNGLTQVVDFFGDMPGLGDATPGPMVGVDVDFGPVTQRFLAGASSACVPGLPAGVWGMHQRWGRVDLSELAKPAVQAAHQGVTMTMGTERSARLLWEILKLTPASQALFQGPDGGPIRTGDPFSNPALGDTLARFAEQGPDWLYTGDGGAAMLRTLGADSAISAADLAAYQPILRQPLTMRYRDARIDVPGAPSQGGPQVLRALQALADGPMPQALHPAEILRIAAAMDVAEQTRPHPMVEHLFGPGFVRGYLGSGFTTHTSVVDAAGNAVSITSSLGETCGLIVPETGIAPNNFLGEADVNPPGHPRPAGQRLMTMCTPTLITRGDDVFALGAGGSSRIRSAVLHGVVYAVDHCGDVERLSTWPRLHMEDGQLRLEVFDRPDGTQRAVAETYGDLVPFNEWSMYMGGLHIAALQGGALAGGGDPRRSGCAGVFSG